MYFTWHHFFRPTSVSTFSNTSVSNTMEAHLLFFTCGCNHSRSHMIVTEEYRENRKGQKAMDAWPLYRDTVITSPPVAAPEQWGQLFLCEQNVIYHQLCRGKPEPGRQRALSLVPGLMIAFDRATATVLFATILIAPALIPCLFSHSNGWRCPSLTTVSTNNYRSICTQGPTSEYHFNTWFISTNAALVQESMGACSVTNSHTALQDQLKRSAKDSLSELWTKDTVVCVACVLLIV